jgi:methyl-accepting chemotaxis protein
MQSATQDSFAAIKEIGATIGRISEIAAAIATTAEAQGEVTEKIARNVLDAARGTTDVATNITDVNRGVAETDCVDQHVGVDAIPFEGKPCPQVRGG